MRPTPSLKLWLFSFHRPARQSGPKDRRPLANVPIARVRVWDHGQISGPVPVNERFVLTPRSPPLPSHVTCLFSEGEPKVSFLWVHPPHPFGAERSC